MTSQLQREPSTSTPVDASSERIKVIRAGVGNIIRVIPLADVTCFDSTEKYENVITTMSEALVRMRLRELASRIDDSNFQKLHRSSLVNFNCDLSTTHDDIGHLSLTLRGPKRPFKVSRAFGHLFKAT